MHGNIEIFSNPISITYILEVMLFLYKKTNKQGNRIAKVTKRTRDIPIVNIIMRVLFEKLT